MASDQHLAILKKGPQAWNAWRQAEPLVRPDLRGVSLTLADKQWGETSGGPINFARALLRGANLRHATLNRCNLSNADLEGANLSGARLRHADLRNASLVNARLDDADLECALLDGADLSGADLSAARNVTRAQVEKARGNADTVLPGPFGIPKTWTAAATAAVHEPGIPLAPFPRQATAEVPRKTLGDGRGPAKSSDEAEAERKAAQERWRASLLKASAGNPTAKPAQGPADTSTPVTAPTSATKRSWTGIFGKAGAGPEARAVPKTGEAVKRAGGGAAAAEHLAVAKPADTKAADTKLVGMKPVDMKSVDLARPAEASSSTEKAAAETTAPAKSKSRWSAHLARSEQPSSAAAGLPIAARPEASTGDAAARAGEWPRGRAVGAASSWRHLARKVAVATVAVGLVASGLIALQLHHRAPIDAAMLNENVPLSAEEALPQEEEAQWLAIGEGKAPDVIEDMKVAEQVAPAADPGDQLALLAAEEEMPIGSITPIKVDEAAAPTLRPESLPRSQAARPLEEPTKIALATEAVVGEPVTATDAREGTLIAQAIEMRAHGELKTPTGVVDRATPLIAPPQAQAPAPVPPAVVSPAPAPERKPGQSKANSPTADKLNFSGQDLSVLKQQPQQPPPPQRRPAAAQPHQSQALQPPPSAQTPSPPQPPSNVVEYLREPQKTAMWIKRLISDFYLSNAALSKSEIEQIYSDPMDFFGEKQVARDRVAREKADYYQHWPVRRYQLVPASIVIRWKSLDLADVTFLYDFEVSAPDSKMNKGRGRAYLTLDLKERPGRIVREDGEVIAEEKPAASGR